MGLAEGLRVSRRPVVGAASVTELIQYRSIREVFTAVYIVWQQ